MKPDYLPPAVPALCAVLLLLCCGCSGTYDISYRDGKLTVSNESTTTGCSAGHTNCSFHCTDLMTDDFNCGSCGKICSGWGVTCRNGNCSCRPDLTDCGGSCASLRDDDFNCGSCGHVCPAGVSCTGGACGTRGGRAGR